MSDKERISFGDWCDMKGIEPTMGQVDAYVRELFAVECRAPAPQPVESSAVDAKELIEISRVILRRLRLLPGDKLRLDLLAKMDIWLMEHTAAAPQVTPQTWPCTRCGKEHRQFEACFAVEGTAEQAPQELELEQEADGRWLAAYTRFPGVAAYGPLKEQAIWNAAKVLIESEPAPPTPELCLGCGQECDIHKGTLVSVNGWYHESCAPKLFDSSPGTTKETTKD